jgi:hypothetical protein
MAKSKNPHKQQKKSVIYDADPFTHGLKAKILAADVTSASAEYLTAYAAVEMNGIDRIVAENQRIRLELAKQEYAAKSAVTGGAQ